MFDGPYALADRRRHGSHGQPVRLRASPRLPLRVPRQRTPQPAAPTPSAERWPCRQRSPPVSSSCSALFGLVVTPLALSIEDKLPWVTIVIGIGLVALGIALLAGRQPTLKIPKLQRGGSDGTLPSMFLFGISYATASLSCTIGPFLAITTTTFRSSSFVAGFGVFLAYALGMGIVIGVLTVALSLAKATLVQRFRNALPTINRVAGGLIVVAGVYVAYYGWYEIRVFNGDTDDPIVDRAIRIQTWLTNHVVPDNPASTALAAVVILGAVASVAALRRRRRRRTSAA